MVFNFEEFIIPSYYLSGQSNNNRWKWRYYLFKKIWQGDGVGTNSYLKIKKHHAWSCCRSNGFDKFFKAKRGCNAVKIEW